MTSSGLNLAHDLSFLDLYRLEGLRKIDRLFQESLAEDARKALLTARKDPHRLTTLQESELVIQLAPFLEEFLGRLFAIPQDVHHLFARHTKLSEVHQCKRLFVQRVALKKYRNADDVKDFDLASLEKEFGAWDDEKFAGVILKWLENEASHKDDLSRAAQYAAWATHTPHGKQQHKHSVLFREPQKFDFQKLIPFTKDERGIHFLPQALRARDGFHLTDSGHGLGYSLDQANYCIWCHERGKDSCRTGIKDKTSDEFQKNPLDITQTGCPLDEKISEMNMVKAQGHALGALAIAIIDNPLLAATGHRICNDCMKSCIYQKQDPVDIPHIETQILRDVLALPWGFEIYSLLTRWNPLNFARPLPHPPTQKRVLVVGMGPAGFNLAHHLLNDGHHVVGIDGLKIEPLNPKLNGRNAKGGAEEFHPIQNSDLLFEDLAKRINYGFGGVAEYGITVRWDKNFLTIIRMLLERRQFESEFHLLGQTRLGSTLTIEQAFAMGFDHIALCLGAGKPNIIDVPHNLAKGVRTASDFLMALQLTGANKKDALANLTLRLPAVVIGGGLTAIDTATEALAYYPLQVEKFLARYESLDEKPNFTAEEQLIADEFLSHGRALREARASGEAILPLLQKWGGVTIAYRRDLTMAPSYRLNHEEVAKALEEGIFIRDHLTPQKIDIDEYGHAQILICRDDDGQNITLPARSLFMAIGTEPNTQIAAEMTEIKKDGRYFTAQNLSGAVTIPGAHNKADEMPPIFCYRDEQKRRISFLGDLHPSFAGNVVKAMASAKKAYPLITAALQDRPINKIPENWFGDLHQKLRAEIVEVKRLTPTIIEVIVKAPLAAQNFAPGQFYRLQNFEALTSNLAQESMAQESMAQESMAQESMAQESMAQESMAQESMAQESMAQESMAMTGAWVDKDKGVLSLIILEMGGSSSLCQFYKAGDPIALMGPTGAPTEIAAGENVLLIGGGLGNAVLFSIGQAFRAKGSKVLYFAGYKQNQDRYKIEEIEKAADHILWCCDEKPNFAPGRASDFVFHGNMVEAMKAYASGNIGDMGAAPLALSDINRVITIGSDGLMRAVTHALQNELAKYFPENYEAIGSINSPMQCMMKEICGQCLQRHIDPVTGAERIVFSCTNQDQNLREVDFACLHDRLSQNNTQEKLTASWIRQILAA